VKQYTVAILANRILATAWLLVNLSNLLSARNKPQCRCSYLICNVRNVKETARPIAAES